MAFAEEEVSLEYTILLHDHNAGITPEYFSLEAWSPNSEREVAKEAFIQPEVTSSHPRSLAKVSEWHGQGML